MYVFFVDDMYTKCYRKNKVKPSYSLDKSWLKNLDCEIPRREVVMDLIRENVKTDRHTTLSRVKKAMWKVGINEARYSNN